MSRSYLPFIIFSNILCIFLISHLKWVGDKRKYGQDSTLDFMKPMNIDYPMQIELFSRSLGLIDLPEDAVITPIPTDEDLSSLSAILMDDEYYHFTVDHSTLVDNIHIADVESLICLKSKAFIDLSERKQVR